MARNHPFPRLVSLRLERILSQRLAQTDRSKNALNMDHLEGALAGLPNLKILTLDHVDFEGPGESYLCCVGRVCPRLRGLIFIACRGYTLGTLLSIIEERERSEELESLVRIALVDLMIPGTSEEVERMKIAVKLFNTRDHMLHELGSVVQQEWKRSMEVLDSHDKLKAHFDNAKLGTITDSRIATKRDGTFRGMGFIGYKTSEEALKAKEFFDRTFVETRRIQVEIVDANKSREGSSLRPVKRPRLDFNLDHPRTEADSSPGLPPPSTLPDSTNSRKEQQLSKFLELMGSSRTAHSSRAWGNEEDFGRRETQLGSAPEAGDERTLEPENRSGTPPGEVSDVQWLKSRMKNTSISLLDEDGGEKIFQQTDEHDREGNREDTHINQLGEQNTIQLSLSHEEAELRRATAQILMTGRLFLRNLTYSCSEEDLRDAFRKYGEIDH
ncbi:Multiple RNA-binding domain-containing protein 1 [Tulasnella sp. 417]|nr:Multiple RNA-binding domain-containing protein 1 [Tulasnella sp. 417]